MEKAAGERISFRILREDQSFDLEVVGGDRADPLPFLIVAPDFWISPLPVTLMAIAGV